VQEYRAPCPQRLIVRMSYYHDTFLKTPHRLPLCLADQSK
jgi:hypothetical protein